MGARPVRIVCGSRVMPSSHSPESDATLVASPAERRRNLRFLFSATVEVTEPRSGAKMMGRTSDLGLGGCYIDTMTPFPAGTEAKIRIVRESETFEAQVKVIFSQIGMGMGVAFVSAQPKQIRIFQKWVLEISGKSAPIPEAEASASVASGQTPDLNGAVLNDLISMLVKKNILTESEALSLVRRLS